MLDGNMSFLFMDALGLQSWFETRQVTSPEMLFTYVIPQNPHEGSANILVFWYNETSAGALARAVTITIPFRLDPALLVILFTVAGAVAASSFMSVKLAKELRRKRERRNQQILNTFSDIFNLNHLMVLEKRTGMNIFNKFFAGKNIDPVLLSGFLTAIRAFGMELMDAEEHSRAMRLEYEKMKLIITTFQNICLIIIVNETPSSDFIKALKFLSEEIERKFSQSLQNFSGEMSAFEGIANLIEKHLKVNLILPHGIDDRKAKKLRSIEQDLLARAHQFLNERGTSTFFISDLLLRYSPRRRASRQFTIVELKATLRLIDLEVFKTEQVREQGANDHQE